MTRVRSDSRERLERVTCVRERLEGAACVRERLERATRENDVRSERLERAACVRERLEKATCVLFLFFVVFGSCLQGFGARSAKKNCVFFDLEIFLRFFHGVKGGAILHTPPKWTPFFAKKPGFLHFHPSLCFEGDIRGRKSFAFPKYTQLTSSAPRRRPRRQIRSQRAPR